MKCALVFLALCSAALAASTTRAPVTGMTFTAPSHSHHHHAAHDLTHLISSEVKAILRAHPDLTVDHCSTKCDAVFDLVTSHDEKQTDQLCKEVCAKFLAVMHSTPMPPA